MPKMIKGLILIRYGTEYNSALEKCKQLFEYQHLLLLRYIWWSKL